MTIQSGIAEVDLHRFWAKVNVDPSGCLLWTAGKFRAGYGQFSYCRRKITAHRFAYLALVGPIPDGLVLDHLCRRPACVNPDHLEPVTDRVNILRGVGPSARNAAKTHCDSGHEFTPENTYFYPDGKRDCRICGRANDRSYGETHRDERSARNRAYREANRERDLARQRAYREANREELNARRRAAREANREELKAQQAAYREANRDQINARQRAYYEANREKVAASNAAYREANRDEIKARRRARRAAKRSQA